MAWALEVTPEGLCLERQMEGSISRDGLQGAGIFAIQEEISRAIVETVRPALLGDGPPAPLHPEHGRL